MSKTLYHKLWPRRGLKTTTITLQTYSKESIAVVGTIDIKVAYEGQTATLPLVIVKGEASQISQISQVRINWSKIHYTTSPGLHKLLQDGLGSFKGYDTKINVDPN